jgi:L-amino acid N-acyltransferase YncA
VSCTCLLALKHARADDTVFLPVRRTANIALLGWQLRDATLEDIAAVREIYRVHVEKTMATMEFDVPSLDEMQARFSKVTQTLGFPYIVAVSSGSSDAGSGGSSGDGSVLGYAYASLFRERKGYACSRF